MIVSFSNTARVEQPFTDNRQQLRRQLAAIRPTHATTRVNERCGSGRPGQPHRAIESEGQQNGEALPATLYILSDGKFPDVEGFALGNLKPVFVPIGAAACRNVGITAFSTKPVEGRTDRLQAFARLENAGPTEIATEVELYRDDVLQEAAAVKIDAGGSASVVFDLADLHEGLLKLPPAPAAIWPTTTKPGSPSIGPNEPKRCWSRRETTPWNWPCALRRPRS